MKEKLNKEFEDPWEIIENADHKSAKYDLQPEGLAKSVEKNSKWRHPSPYEILII